MPPLPLKGHPCKEEIKLTNVRLPKPESSDLVNSGLTNPVKSEMSPKKNSVQSINRDEGPLNNNSPGRLKFFKGKSHFQVETTILHFFAIIISINNVSRHFKYSQVCVQRPHMGPENSGRCLQVVVVQRYLYAIKAHNGTTKWWSLLAGGRYSEVVVSSGLTVFGRPCSLQ